MHSHYKYIKYFIIIGLFIAPFTVIANNDGLIDLDIEKMYEQENGENTEQKYLSETFDIPIFTEETVHKLAENEKEQERIRQEKLSMLFLGTSEVKNNITNDELFKEPPVTAMKTVQIEEEYYKMDQVIYVLIGMLFLGAVILFIYFYNHTEQVEGRRKHERNTY